MDRCWWWDRLSFILHRGDFRDVVVDEALLDGEGMPVVLSVRFPRDTSMDKTLYPLDPAKRKLFGRSSFKVAQNASLSDSSTMPNSL